ncbi:MAG: hypothetical protein GX539_10285 [Candidatus Cloacimonetes bacterium]|nr:hypothetical protein [Candidatus Cloacimonadota bacterium]
MYSTCIFCNGALGTNEVLEDFPVGRRIAFDAARGRLWVVCRRCERWNLSPIEERWEAIEAAERIFRETRMRVSTDQIGLARHREGLELVRIGAPQRPEFAAWRYGDQFGRRRRRALLVGGATAGVIGTVAIAGVVTGVLSGAILAQSGNFVNLWQNARTLVRVRAPDGRLLKLKRPDLQAAALRPDTEAGGFVLELRNKRRVTHVFRGEQAERIAGVMMPRLNAAGARPSVVQDAVTTLERAGGPEAFLEDLLRTPPVASRGRRQLLEPGTLKLGRLPTPSRLALEMALHEEQERRALEGELKALELAWQEAEEVAAIADDLLLPDRVLRMLGRA